MPRCPIGSDTTAVPGARRWRCFAAACELPGSARGGGIAEVAEPQMEMHGIARERVEGLVVQAGGRILDVRPDTWPGPGWLSFIYTVTK